MLNLTKNIEYALISLRHINNNGEGKLCSSSEIASYYHMPKELLAKKIKLIDIIDKNYPYDKWTSHFRNYNSLNRKPFQILSKEIINLI